MAVHSLMQGGLAIERHAILVQGIVQGVGFRPFVQTLATRWGLVGSVQNQHGGVLIEIEGEVAALAAFLRELVDRPPPLAQITGVHRENLPPRDERQFRILPSELVGSSAVFIPADVATCADCLRELFDATNRRYRYPFINCTNCGPRLTIITAAPYDRARTTMAGFPLCSECDAEYHNPQNRRFHAEPLACSKCGPQLTLHSAEGNSIGTSDLLVDFASRLLAGQIGALQGIGGFHLVCDARNERAVQELRQRKGREEKPFAVMVSDLAAARCVCQISVAEAKLLSSPQAPIVLLRRIVGGDSNNIAAAIAPQNPYLGILLPYSPIDHLLMHGVAGTPLVMTSGNRKDEPIAIEIGEALQRLSGIADVFLVHNRPIHIRCDDSVTRVVRDVELPVRRSRGYAPQPIPLKQRCPISLLAMGGQLKSTFALARDNHAFISHHLGDLDHFEAFQAYERDISLYQNLFELDSQLIVHDQHPDYASTQIAKRLAKRRSLPRIAVQHHHAHMASCLAENGHDGEAIGVVFDGSGYGIDEQTGMPTVWGGEFLVGSFAQVRRAAHFRNVPMPGGEAVIREPWRMALAYLHDAACDSRVLESRIEPSARQIVARMLSQRLNCPLTSSVGRLFDAVTSLLGIRDRATYEGQPAIELEWLATASEPQPAYLFEITSEIESANDWPGTIDCRPLIRTVVDDVAAGIATSCIARRFHVTIVAMISQTCQAIRRVSGINRVALSGGVFLNSLLLSEAIVELEADGFQVFRHRLVPPSDGGLCLGQIAVAAAQLRDRADAVSP